MDGSYSTRSGDRHCLEIGTVPWHIEFVRRLLDCSKHFGDLRGAWGWGVRWECPLDYQSQLAVPKCSADLFHIDPYEYAALWVEVGAGIARCFCRLASSGRWLTNLRLYMSYIDGMSIARVWAVLKMTASPRRSF